MRNLGHKIKGTTIFIKSEPQTPVINSYSLSRNGY